MGGGPVGRAFLARKELFAILAITFLYMLGRSMVSPISPQYFQLAHVSIFGIGVLLGGFGFAFLLSEAAWGFVSSRVQSRWTFFALILISSLLPIPMAVPQSFAVLFAIQITSGLCLGGMGVLPRLLVPQLANPGDEARSFGYLGMVFSLGGMAGSLLGGGVYGAVGLSSSFIVAGLISTSPLLPLWFLHFRRPVTGPSVSIRTQETMTRLHRTPLPLTTLLALGFVGIATASASIFYGLLLPNILTRDPNYSASVSGVSLVIALFSFSSGAFQPIMGSVGSRNPRKWITLAIIGSASTFVLLSYSNSMSEVYVITFLAGVASSAVTPLALSVLSAGIPLSRLGRVFGLYGAAEDSGIILGALAGSFLWADFGSRSAFTAMAVFFLVTGVIYGLVSAWGSQREQPAGAQPPS